MSLSSIQKAFDDYLSLFQTEDVAWEGTFYAPQIGRPYLAPRMQGRDRNPAGFGADALIRYDGVYQIGVFFPIGEGLERLNVAVDQLMAHFRRGTSLTTADGFVIRIEVPSPPPALQQPDWIMVPVQIRWFCYELPS